MNLSKTEFNPIKIKRLREQLMESEAYMQRHPFLKNKWVILQSTLHALNGQLERITAGQWAHLEMTLKFSLFGQDSLKSQTGFIGPSLAKIHELLAQFMQASIHPTEIRSLKLLSGFTELMELGVVYLTTQALGIRKGMFPENDPVENQRAGFLFRQLGLNFVLSSNLLESAFRHAAQGLGLREASQKRVTAIGIVYLLILLAFIDEQDNPKHSEFLETLSRFLQPELESLEEAILNAKESQWLDENQTTVLRNCLQTINLTVRTGDSEGLKKILENSFEILKLSFQEINQDLNRLIKHCSQLNESFNNIFYQTEMTATTLTHTA